MLVKERTFEEIALADPDRKWELHRGALREKPPMTDAHQWLMWRLTRRLMARLDYDRFDLRADSGRVRSTRRNYYIPDVYVVARSGNRSLAEATHQLEVFVDPLPFVAEVWSPSTGDYDVEEKLQDHQSRGDLEIWRLHPVERTLTAWRLQPNGEYLKSEHHVGRIELFAIPGVVIDLDALFA